MQRARVAAAAAVPSPPEEAGSRSGRHAARGDGAARGGGLRVALAVDAIVRGGGEDAVDLEQLSDGLAEAHAKCGEVVHPGLSGAATHAPAYSSAARSFVCWPEMFLGLGPSGFEHKGRAC